MLFGFLSCTGKQLKQSESSDDKEIILLGSVEIKDFKSKPYVSWYDSTYQAYESSFIQKDILDSLLTDTQIEVFFGTWCSDSQRELPAFHKIIDGLSFDIAEIKYYALDRDKVEPANSQEGRNIEFVPTFIFSKNDVELGRIIENPLESLEEDMLQVLSKKTD